MDCACWHGGYSVSMVTQVIAVCFISTAFGALATRWFMGEDSAVGGNGIGLETLYITGIAIAKALCFAAVIHLTHNTNLHSMRAIYVVCGLVSAFLYKLTHHEMTSGELAMLAAADVIALWGCIEGYHRFIR